jgi:hypothetical protein
MNKDFKKFVVIIVALLFYLLLYGVYLDLTRISDIQEGKGDQNENIDG